MERAFTSLAELRTEIDILKIKQFHQEEELKEKFSNPSELIRVATSLFKGKKSHGAGQSSLVQNLLHQDIITNITRVALPIILNSLVFKKSGFVVKTLVTFLSQKVAKNINTNAIAGITEKVQSWFASKKQERAQKVQQKAYTTDYGIPPDSETY